MTVASLEPEPEIVAPPPPSARSANASSAQIVRNALWSYVSAGSAMLIGFVLTPILVRRLGSQTFGLWVLLGSLVGYLTLIELGLGTATAKRVAECRAIGSDDRLRQVLGTAAVMYAVIACAVMLLSAVLALVLPHLFSIPPASVAPARLALLLLGLNQALLFLFVVQSAILMGSGRFDLNIGVGLVISTASGAASVTLALCGFGIVPLALTAVATTLLSGLVTRRIIRRRLGGVSISPGNATWSMARELLKYGARNSIVALCGTIAYGADSLVIGLLLPIANVAHYAVAAKMIGLVRTLATKPIDVLMPVYSHSHALGDHERLFRLFTRSVTVPLAIAIPFVIAIGTFGQELVRLWVGRGHEVSYAIALTLGLALLFQLPGHASYTIFTGTERNKYLVLICGIAAPINLALSVLLTTRLGPVGMALGSVLTVLISDAILLPLFVCRQFGFGFRRYVVASLRPLILPTSLAVVVAFCTRALLSNLPPIATIAGAGSVLLSFWIVATSMLARSNVTKGSAGNVMGVWGLLRQV